MNIQEILETTRIKYDQDKNIINGSIMVPLLMNYLNGENNIGACLRIMYSDIRYDGTNYSGKVLTDIGHNFLSLFFDFKSYDITGTVIRPKDMIFLFKTSKMPYHIGNRDIIFYDLELAGMFRLYGSKLDLLTDMYFNEE